MESPRSGDEVSADGHTAGCLRDRAEQLEGLRGCLQKALGHELPNHLVAIQGLVNLLSLEEGERLTAEGRDYLARLGAAARRAHDLVAALANVCRAARKPGQVSVAVALGDVVTEAAAEVKRMFPGSIFEYHLTGADIDIKVPRSDLRQVFVQLLKNAVRAAGVRPRKVEIGFCSAPVGREIFVTDDGGGISLERQQQLFEPFVTSSQADGGNGLGLFLVRCLVECWGGTVRVESQPGQGTTVIFSLPADALSPNE